jgi:PhnB protein
MTIRGSPHLTFAGECAAAFRFYERALGGKIVTLLTYGETAMAGQFPPEWRGKIVHASLKAGDLSLAGADLLPQQYQRPQGFYVLLEVPDPGEAERVFQALGEKGYVQLALQRTFWSPAFGVLVDQFGIPWEINCTPEGSPGRRP